MSGRQPRVALEVAAEIDAGMLHQVLADAGAVGDARWMPSAASSFAGPMPLRIRNAGECSAPIDTIDLARVHVDRSAAAPHAHAGDARAVEQQPLRARAAQDRQVRPLPDVARQIRHGGRDAVIVDVGDRDREIAVAERAVLVVEVLEAEVVDCLEHALRRSPASPIAMRRSGTGPSLPCSGPSKSWSLSSLRKNGSTPFQSQPVAPRAAHSS